MGVNRSRRIHTLEAPSGYFLPRRRGTCGVDGIITARGALWLPRERSGLSTQQPSFVPSVKLQTCPSPQSSSPWQQGKPSAQQMAPQQSGNSDPQHPPPSQQTPPRPQHPCPQQTGKPTKQQPSPCATVQHTWPSEHSEVLVSAGQVIGSVVQVTLHCAFAESKTTDRPFPPSKVGFSPPASAHASAQEP